MPSALMATIGADATPFNRELKATEAVAGQSATRMGNTLSGIFQNAVAGQSATQIGNTLIGNTLSGIFQNANFRTVFRELLVVFREIGRGNWARVPGSLSIIFTALGGLTLLLSPLVIALAAVALAGYKVIKWSHDALSAQKALSTSTNELKGRYEALAGALQHAAERAQSFHDWLSRLGESHESIAQSAEEELKTMRERYSLQQQIAQQNGQTPKQRAQAELIQAQKERDYIEAKIKSQNTLLEADKRFATRTETNANNPQAAADLEGKQKAAKSANEIVAAARLAYVARFGSAPDSDDQRFFHAGNKNDRLDVELNGKKLAITFAEAEQSASGLNAQVSAYTAKQKELNDSAENAKKAAERQSESLEKLQKLFDELGIKIKLDKEFIPQITDGAKSKIIHGHVNNLQAIGAFTSPAQIESVSQLKGIHHTLKTIHQDLTKQYKEPRHSGHGGAKF